MEYKHHMIDGDPHFIIDDDPHFIIDPDTRAISYVSPDKLVLIQGDHNSERFTFELPAVIDGHEMAKSNLVQVHYININGSDTSERSSGVYEVTDLKLVSDGDNEKVVFSWLVSQKATLNVGVLNFAIRFKCQIEEGKPPEYVWNTAPYSGVTISTGIDSGEEAVEEYYDILDEWYNKLVNAGATSIEAINEAKDKAVEDIDDAKNEALTEIDAQVKASSDAYVEEFKSTVTVDVLNYHELLVQEKGYNPDKMMSQKATTEELNALESEVVTKTVEAVNEARSIASELEEKILAGVPSAKYIVDSLSRCKIASGQIEHEDFEVYIAPVGGVISWNVKFRVILNGLEFDKEIPLDGDPLFDALAGHGVLLENVQFYIPSSGEAGYPAVSYMIDGVYANVQFTEFAQYNNSNIDDYDLYLVNVDKVYRINTPHEYTFNANGIADITKTGTNGLVDSYTISFDNGQTKTFDVTNGNGITSVEKTDSGIHEDTYTMYFADGSSITFNIPNGTVPDYVNAEADAVVKRILSVQNENTFTFATITDTHVNYGNQTYSERTLVSIKHAGMAINRVASQIGIDFMCNLGDNLWGTNEDVDLAKNEQLLLNQAIYDTFRGYPNFRLVGNHDANLWNHCISTASIYSMNGRYNTFDEVGPTKIRGYGYKDFDHVKVRVLGMNTSDYIDGKGGYYVSDEQMLWLMSALDLSDKTDADEWQVLLLSHIPLDFPTDDTDTCHNIMAILEAYKNGTSVTVEAGSYDYSGKNKAAIICNIHGHIHNFSRGLMENGVLRMCTPNTCFYNNGSPGVGVDEPYQPNESYNKITNSAEDTTVTFYTIDTKNRVVYSTNYGAGYDRAVTYDGVDLYEEPFEEVVADLAVAPRNSWSFDPSATNNLILGNANSRLAIGVSTPNDFAFTDRETKPIYVMPVPAKARKVTVTNADGVSYKYGYVFYKSVNGVFTKVLDDGWTTETEYSFAKGVATHITISAETSDGSFVPWGYDDSQITVTFSN